MSKNTKIIIVAIVIIVLLAAIIWVVYESFKSEPASIGETNVLPNENMGIDNVTNDFLEEDVNNVNETNSVDTNVVANEMEDEHGSSEEPTIESNSGNNSSNDNKDSEKVYGTVADREARAVELAKEYYEEEYGNADELNFDYEALNGDGRYIVRAGKPGVGRNKFFYVDIDTEIVEEK